MPRTLPVFLLPFLLAACSAPDDRPFTVVALPDTQFYAAGMHGGSPELFTAQTRWIVSAADTLNVAFVTQLGDCVQHGDSLVAEWEAADAAFSLLEDPAATGRADGIPYGIAVGNHDQSPEGDADGTTTYFNRFFGADRFTGRAYYGGHYGDLNDNHVQLFSASGLDFLILHLEYDLTPDPAVLDWADALLKTHADRRAVVVTHYLIEPGDQGDFSPQGRAIYDALKDNPNLFLMLGGHRAGEGQRVDTFEGNTVYSLLADYQSRDNGGDGWLRILEFVPETDEIRVRTFSPVLDEGRGRHENDADSRFTLPYEM